MKKAIVIVVFGAAMAACGGGKGKGGTMPDNKGSGGSAMAPMGGQGYGGSGGSAMAPDSPPTGGGAGY